MPKVWNKHHKNAPADAVYVGRPTAFGNCFTHLPSVVKKYPDMILVRDREAAVAAYETMVRNEPIVIAIIKNLLKGKDLVCWCAPEPCHADVLLKIANE